MTSGQVSRRRRAQTAPTARVGAVDHGLATMVHGPHVGPEGVLTLKMPGGAAKAPPGAAAGPGSPAEAALSDHDDRQLAVRQDLLRLAAEQQRRHAAAPV